MQFELWLDESGDFQSDMNLARNPSLVGGLLIPKDQIDAQTAREILGKDYVHFNQEKSSYTLQVLEMIKTNHAEFVIFENRERVKIINSDTTYLNVLAEGIIQLLLQLSAQYGDFELHILVATRKNLEQGYGIIPFEQYEQKLRERVIVGLARKALTKKNDWKYTIQFGDARDNFKLMLADGVCNTYLTRTSGKFTQTERGRIEDLYNSPYKFSFFENTVEQHIKRLLAQGKFSDALYEIYTNNELEQPEHFLEITLKRFSQLDDHSKKIQLLDISKKIETLIRIDRKYNYVKPALVKIQSELLPLLEQQQIIVPEFQLDIILFLYTIHTHEGSAAGDALDQLSLQQIQRIEDIMTKLKYYNIYKIRRGIHEKNMLNLNASIDDLSKGIRVLEDMLAMIELIEDDILNKSTIMYKYEDLGKAYGTRGQAYTMLIHEDSDNLQNAINDFDHALHHFVYTSDKERQYLYKSHAYAEANQFEEALSFLFQASGLTYHQQNFNELLTNLKEQPINHIIFKYASYFKIMAFAKEANNDVIADAMYQALNEANIKVESIQKAFRFPHPLQFIMWSMATFQIGKGKLKLANQYLDIAISICDQLPFDQLTFKVIQLGLLANKALVNNENTNYLKQIVHLYEQITHHPNASTIPSYLANLSSLTETTITQTDLTKLVKITRCIN